MLTVQSFSDELRFLIPSAGLPVISYTCDRQCRAQGSYLFHSQPCQISNKMKHNISIERRDPHNTR